MLLPALLLLFLYFILGMSSVSSFSAFNSPFKKKMITEFENGLDARTTAILKEAGWSPRSLFCVANSIDIPISIEDSESDVLSPSPKLLCLHKTPEKLFGDNRVDNITPEDRILIDLSDSLAKSSISKGKPENQRRMKSPKRLFTEAPFQDGVDNNNPKDGVLGEVFLTDLCFFQSSHPLSRRCVFQR